MWLPKDERRLLAGYYALIRAVGTEKAYHLSDLARLLRFRGHRRRVPEYGESEGSTDNCRDLESTIREIDREIDARIQIEKANTLLTARGLITCTPQQHETDVVVIGLSVDGYDLGRRYSRSFSSIGLWFNEYRNHWICLILAIFVTAFRNKLIEWIGLLGDA